MATTSAPSKMPVSLGALVITIIRIIIRILIRIIRIIRIRIIRSWYVYDLSFQFFYTGNKTPSKMDIWNFKQCRQTFFGGLFLNIPM